MIRETRIVSIHNTPMVIFEGPECISDDIVKYNNFWEFELFNKWKEYFPTTGLMLDIGGLYKDRKDRVFGLSVGYDGTQVVYGVSSYWKIKFK